MTYYRRHILGSMVLSLLPFCNAKAEDHCIHDDLGETCVDKTASRVVALDQQSIEFMLALGIQPVGVTSPANYRKFTGDAAPELSYSVQDLGLSSSPNIELIMALQPDLILGNITNVQKNLSLLKEIAPVSAFASYPSGHSDQFNTMLSNLRTIARLVGRATEADHFCKMLDTTLDTGYRRLASLGLTSKPVVLGNINAGARGAEIMLFNQNALPAQILKRLGFSYACHDERYREKGFTVTSVETLMEFENADFLYMPFNEKGMERLIQTPIWRNLRFVREKRLHSIPYRLIHNAPLSTHLFQADVVSAFQS